MTSRSHLSLVRPANRMPGSHGHSATFPIPDWAGRTAYGSLRHPSQGTADTGQDTEYGFQMGQKVAESLDSRPHGEKGGTRVEPGPGVRNSAIALRQITFCCPRVRNRVRIDPPASPGNSRSEATPFPYAYPESTELRRWRERSQAQSGYWVTCWASSCCSDMVCPTVFRPPMGVPSPLARLIPLSEGLTLATEHSASLA